MNKLEDTQNILDFIRLLFVIEILVFMINVRAGLKFRMQDIQMLMGFMNKDTHHVMTYHVNVRNSLHG